MQQFGSDRSNSGPPADIAEPTRMAFETVWSEDDVDQLLGNATTETIGGIVISVCDGDPGPLLEACADQNVNAFVRLNLLTALARLAFDGVIAREVAVEFFDRFEREPLAEPDDPAWQGWQDAISLLGLEEMREGRRGD